MSVTSDKSTPQPPQGFTDRFEEANGIRVHYVTGGAGPTVVLFTVIRRPPMNGSRSCPR